MRMRETLRGLEIPLPLSTLAPLNSLHARTRRGGGRNVKVPIAHSRPLQLTGAHDALTSLLSTAWTWLLLL